MRKLLLAGVALAGASAYLTPAANAQSPVFPTTTQAGKLDGAAPGSVTVSLGGRIFSALEFESGTGDSGSNKVSSPNLVNYIRFYPNFDYVNPSGIHFGAAMEIRTEGAQQGVGSGHNTLFGFAGQGYVSSDKFGKFAFGTPNSATDQLGVGTGDDFGTGGFYSEYGWVNNPAEFAMTDAYDGNVPKQKLAYYSPSFAGFTVGVSYQPTSVGLNNSGGLVDSLGGSCVTTPATATTPASTSCTNANGASGAQSKNRVEGEVQFSHAFGPFSLKAAAGYATADHSEPGGTPPGVSYQTVSAFNGGAVVNIAGFELEGQAVTGKWAYNGEDSGSPFGPSVSGAHTTTSFIVGVGYTFGPFSIGGQYYGVRFDQGDLGAISDTTGKPNTGKQGQVDGFALGGSYSVGPGVSVNFDLATNTTKVPGATITSYGGETREKTHGTVFGFVEI